MQACSYWMSSCATDLPEKISVLQTWHLVILRAGEGPATPTQGLREALETPHPAAPTLCNRRREEGHPQHPDGPSALTR